MKNKPPGPRYRNLYVRSGVIYYQRRISGRKVRFSTKTDSWEEAAAVRDVYEDRKGIGRPGVMLLREVPRLADFADRYLAEDTQHLASSTREDRPGYLRPEGPLGALGSRPLDEITVPVLREWWTQEIEGRGLSRRTGGAYLSVLASVLNFAVELGLIERSPISDFREPMRSRSRTQRGRAEADPSRSVRPIEEPAQLARLVNEAHAEGSAAYLLVVLLLDAGLRLGEALGLRWGDIDWGADDGDRGRSLRIRRARARGGPEGPPKSGRERQVGLSVRLRDSLADHYRERFEPSPEAYVLEGIDPSNFRKREWRRILERAKLGHRALKDLRDTFASQLLTAGVQLGYVSQQLGHADVAVTARHYARWVGGAEYREAIQLKEGELPADVLARLDRPQTDPTPEAAEAQEAVSNWTSKETWRARHDSNVRPPVPQTGALSN